MIEIIRSAYSVTALFFFVAFMYSSAGVGAVPGSYTSAVKYPAKLMEKVSGVVILVAIVFLARKVILLSLLSLLLNLK